MESLPLDRGHDGRRVEDWTAPQMTRFLPQGRTAFWALLIFTAWMIILWATTVSIAPIVMWFIGMVVVILLSLMSGSKHNVRIYGPSGKEWLVSAATAERRVKKGWSYQPLAPRP
jgi:hypothetical protein